MTVLLRFFSKEIIICARHTCVLLVVALASIVVIEGCGGDGGTPPATTYSISGTVSGADSSGVTMTLSGASNATSTTSGAGAYSFTGLANGNYTVTPSKAGYTFSPANLAVTVNGENVTGQNFTSSATATICTAAAGLRCPTGSAWEARHGLDAATYQQTFDTLVGQGYRLSHVNGYGVAGQARYAAIWEKCDSPAWEARHDLDATTYQQTFDTLVGQGYRLVEVSGYEVSSGSTLYAAIWEKRVGPAWEARHGLDATTYQQTFDTLVGQGYRLIHVSGYPLAGQARYAAIWEKCDSPAWEARHGLDATTYQQTFDTLAGQGYHPVQVSGYTVGAQDLYSAIFEKSTVPAWEARHGLDAATYQQTFDTLVGQGYRLADVSGYEDGYAAIWTK